MSKDDGRSMGARERERRKRNARYSKIRKENKCGIFEKEFCKRGNMMIVTVETDDGCCCCCCLRNGASKRPSRTRLSSRERVDTWVQPREFFFYRSSCKFEGRKRESFLHEWCR